MRRLNLPFIFVFILVFSLSLSAQVPQYYNSNSTGIGNTIPFGSTGVNGYMAQYLMLAGEFAQPTPAPAGNITKLYIRMSSTGGPATYSHLVIMMGQATITVFPTGTQYTGPLDTVYHNASATLSSTANNWMMITLDEPFNYNPAQSLIIQISQCSFTGTGMSVWQTAGTTGVYRRNNLPGTPACTFTYSSQDGRILQCGVDIAPVANYTVPDLIYYKFENNPTATTTPNYAVPGAGNPVGTLETLTLESGGQFDTCTVGTGTASAKITTGYNLSTGMSSFTISMWLGDMVEPASTRYIFGDAGHSFRCFLGGVAPTNGAVLRGTGVTDVEISNLVPGPTVVHIVYDSASHSVTIYKNGVPDNTVVQATPWNFTAGTGFTVGGYSTSAGLQGKMDEFRFYKRALDSAEIAATWNIELGGTPTVINPVKGKIPDSYVLNQNYPNPFNPVTKISFAIPKSGFVTLKVFDVLGREVASLVNAQKNTGSYIVDFDASNLSSGIYFYKLEVNGFVDTKKMMVLK